MAGELVSFRYIVDGRTCLDWYVLNVGDEQVVFLDRWRAGVRRPLRRRALHNFVLRFLENLQRKRTRLSGRSAASWERTADRGATIKVGGCSTAQQFGRFVTLELKTGRPTGVRLRLWCGTFPRWASSTSTSCGKNNWLCGWCEPSLVLLHTGLSKLLLLLWQHWGLGGWGRLG